MQLQPKPLTAEAFAPFGDVIETTGARSDMNEGSFKRFDGLAAVDMTGGKISIVRCRSAAQLPYQFNQVERHPLGSQAFIPRTPFSFLVVVAAAGDLIGPEQLAAFVTDGRQGVNYHRGTWHMPLIALAEGQEFLVVDRGEEGNCDRHRFSAPITLLAAE